MLKQDPVKGNNLSNLERIPAILTKKYLSPSDFIHQTLQTYKTKMKDSQFHTLGILKD